jgi:hypothetical protein
MPSPALLHRHAGFRRVVVASGHMTDLPGRRSPRFPESAVPQVRREVGERLDAWGLGADDLLICGGSRGADLVIATEARRRAATVWVLLARPDPSFEADSVAGADPAWTDTFRDMLQRTPSWDATQIGVAADDDDLYARTNTWLLDVATAQQGDEPVHVVAVWDGRSGDGPGGTADLVAQAQRRGMLVDVVRPPL